MATEEFRHDVVKALRDHALSFPGVNESDSCVKRAFRARTKGFLFLGEKPDSYNVMLKLGDSVDEAVGLTEERSERWSVGKFNWVTMHFDNDEVPPDGLLERWIEESYRLLAPKKLLAELD